MAGRPKRTTVAAALVLAAAGLAAARGLGSDAPAGVTTPRAAFDPSVSPSDAQAVSAVLAAAKAGDGPRIRAAMVELHDPLARKIAEWALAEAAPDSMSFLEADDARRDLAGWPGPARRQLVAEALLDQAGMSPRQVIAWFGGEGPQTGRGALALAAALGATGHAGVSGRLIRKAWRTLVFDEDTQAAILARFGADLGQADHTAREDLLLYGAQGPAAQDLLRFLPPEEQALAQARMAVRRGDPSAQSLIDALPVNRRAAPGLVYEQVISLRDHGDTAAAVALVGRLPASLSQQAAAERLWKHGSLVAAALETGNGAGAHAAATHSGLASGADAADAEFQAGWIALERLKDARGADAHFQRLQALGRSPLTQSRALYWRGRAAEALGDPIAAQGFYAEAARYYTTFYGQLAAAKTGAAVITLGRDPPITPADAARFEAREPVRAARLLAGIGAKDTFKAFVGALSETLPSAQEEALLVDFTRGWGDQEAAMRVVRNAARRGFILPERGYPIRTAPAALGAPEAPFVLGITRQESSFDPRARSGAGARGMMQLMPATAQGVARRLGLSYDPQELDDPDYNMRLGSAFLGDLVGEFSGSYLMAAAAYNAGPGRPVQWSATCGDPRSSSTDPVDFIECIPFSETRDYVMRVLEATQVYRARLAGGSAPITLAADLKRGAYGYAGGYAARAPARGR